MNVILNKFISLIIVFLIATEGLFVGQYMIIGIAGYRWFELIIFIFLINSFLKDIKSNKFIYFYIKFLFLLITFLAIRAGYLLFFKGYIDFIPIEQMFRIPFFLIIPYLIYYIVNKNILYLKIILFLQIIIFSIAFFQFPLTPLTDLAWELKTNYFMANSTHDLRLLKSRVCSLYGYAIPFSYALTTGGIICTYLYKKTNNIIYIFILIFILIIATMSLTRSAVLAQLVLFFYILITQEKKNSWLKYIIILSLIYILSTLFSEYAHSFSRVSDIKDSSATGRIPLLITGIYTLITNPLGITPNSYQIAKEEMYAVFQNPNILEFAAHNGLISFGFYYTLIGLFVFMYLLFFVKKKYLIRLEKRIKTFFIVTFFSYLLQAFFHNNFIFVKDFNILIIVALLIYEYKLSNTQRIKNVK